jgi:hypothetical protein
MSASTTSARSTGRGRTDGPVGRRLRDLRRDDTGMSTAEYAIGTVAAAGFAALLYTVISGNSVVGALTGIIQRALTAAF